MLLIKYTILVISMFFNIVYLLHWSLLKKRYQRVSKIPHRGTAQWHSSHQATGQAGATSIFRL